MQTPTQLDRSARLFQFLQEFTQLKYKPKRTNDDSTLLWLHALPEQPEVDNAARAPEGATPEDWLSVRKPRLRPAPTRPEDLQPWVSGPLGDPPASAGNPLTAGGRVGCPGRRLAAAGHQRDAVSR